MDLENTDERVKYFLECFEKAMPEVRRQIAVYEKYLKEIEENKNNDNDKHT